MRLLVLMVLGACSSVDPVVGDWAVRTLEVDGDSYTYPEPTGQMAAYSWSFTEEPRGLLSLSYLAEESDAARTVETYPFTVDVFAEGRWLLEIEDASHDMIQDCEAVDDGMTCVGSCDGLDGCNWTLDRE
jgi:hypothetical protein